MIGIIKYFWNNLKKHKLKYELYKISQRQIELMNKIHTNKKGVTPEEAKEFNKLEGRKININIQLRR